MNYLHSKHKKLVLNSVVSLMLLLAAGCSDSDGLTRITDNNNQESSETEKGAGTDTNNDGDSSNDSSADTVVPPNSGGSNPEQGGGVNGDDNTNQGTGTGDNGESVPPSNEGDGTDTPPSEGGDTEVGQLSFRFHRTTDTESTPPRQVNQEIVGRAYEISIYQQSDKGPWLEDVTDLVTWTAVSETCRKEPCFKVTADKKLRATSEGVFTFTKLTRNHIPSNGNT